MSNNGSLDLVLLTDEPITWEGDYWFRSNERIERQMRALGITREEKERVERRHGINEYFRSLGTIPGTDQEVFRIRVPHRPHLSLCDLATVATAAGHEVRVVDNMFRYPSRMKEVESLLGQKPRAIGISTTFLLTPQVVRDYVEKIRPLAPESKIILGGPTVRKAKELHGYADFAVFGDGEDPLLGILDVLRAERSPDTVAHIAYRDEDGGVNYGPSGMESSHLNVIAKPYKARDVGLPIPDWRLVNRSFDNVFAIEFSRGCKYNCFYCSYDRGKNVRDMAHVREELLTNAKLGITKYRVSDSNFTDGPPKRKQYPHEVCNLMIELDLGLKWSSYARVDDLCDYPDGKLAGLMRRAGCFGVFFGVESGSDKILKNMRKGHNAADAAEGIRMAKGNGLLCHASFIVGYPGETLETYEETLEFIERTRPDTVNLGQFRVEHDTPVYGVKEFGLEGQGMVWHHKTMDHETADELVVKGNERLVRNGVCLGTECGFPVYMGLGLSLEESHQFMRDMDTVGEDRGSVGPEEFQRARQRLRMIMLERFPEAIAKDQRAWRGGA